jgi:hypothetical protein
MFADTKRSTTPTSRMRKAVSGDPVPAFDQPELNAGSSVSPT